MNNGKALLSSILENRGGECLRGVIMTVDRGYAPPKMLQEIANYGVASVGIMPEYVVKSHPFVRFSSLKPRNYDEDISSSDELMSNGEEETCVVGRRERCCFLSTISSFCKDNGSTSFKVVVNNQSNA